MKTKIKQILLDNLKSAYDGGNIDDGGITGGDKTIDKLYDLFVDEFSAMATAKISTTPIPEVKKPKKLLYTNRETGKPQKLFEILNPVYTVCCRNENVVNGYKGSAVYITLEALDEDDAINKAMKNKEFVSHFYDKKKLEKKYLQAYKPNGNYVIGKVDYYSGDPRL